MYDNINDAMNAVAKVAYKLWCCKLGVRSKRGVCSRLLSERYGGVVYANIRDSLSTELQCLFEACNSSGLTWEILKIRGGYSGQTPNP